MSAALNLLAEEFSALDVAFADFLQKVQPSGDPRHELLAALTSHQFGRGHACLDLQALLEEPANLLGWEARRVAQLPVELGQAAADLPWARGSNSPMVLDGPRLYLRRAWRAEQDIRSAIRDRLNMACTVPDDLHTLLDALFPPALQAASLGEADLLPDLFPDWQRVACALAARKRLTLITGGPGTGKTTTVVRLLALLQTHARSAGTLLRIALAAPTGKAAARLADAVTGAIAQLPADMQADLPGTAVTLHRLLGTRSSGETAPLAADLVVVDEASMIDLEMMARLLAAVPLSASLVLLGDKDQLASVEAGAVMAQLCEGASEGLYTADTVRWAQDNAGVNIGAWEGRGSSLAQQTVMLRQSRRFSATSAIGQWAKAVNAGDVAEVERLWERAPSWVACDGSAPPDEVSRVTTEVLRHVRLGDIARHGWDAWLDELRALAQRSCEGATAMSILQAFGRFQVLCAVRAGPYGVTQVNAAIAHALGFPPSGWFAGRPVMVTRNDYNLKLMNGDVGMCLPQAKGLRVAFSDGNSGVRWVLPSRLDAVETVFAMTVHKSQGSEFDHVLLALPDVEVGITTRELLYTGITRAKTRLTVLAPSQTVLLNAVRARVVRSGGLAHVTHVTQDSQEQHS
jgi:exodeoxyribonuclease V alpha subunit